MRLVELNKGESFWSEVLAGELQPFGEIGTGLSWRDKTLNLGLRSDDGRLLALAGLVAADVRVGSQTLTVAGLGSVIVTRDARGQGLGRAIVEHALARASELAERAMLFCDADKLALYRKFGFIEIQGPVTAGQPDGVIEMPMHAMWKPLRPDADWPPGRVAVIGEPF